MSKQGTFDIYEESSNNTGWILEKEETEQILINSCWKLQKGLDTLNSRDQKRTTTVVAGHT